MTARADSVAAILRFQQLTMQSMFQSIQDELTRVGSSAAPTDYLNFFCLGNRASGPLNGPDKADGKKDAGVLSERHRRFMIYVHSKCMVVDDEIALIGAPPVHLAVCAMAVLACKRLLHGVATETSLLPRSQAAGCRVGKREHAVAGGHP